MMPNDTNLSGDDVTVVIPALNAEKWIPQLIQQIEAQTVTPKAVILVDSSSTDKTQELLDGLQTSLDIHYHRIEFAYPGHARNIGVELAKTKWIAFLDCQTLPEPSWLEESLSVIVLHDPAYVKALSVFEANTRFKQTLIATTYGNTTVETLPGSLILKSAFEEFGGFFPDVRAGEDIEWKDRLEASGIKTARAGRPLLKYSGFPHSLSKAAKKWFTYAMSNAYIDVYNLQKKVYLLVLILMGLFFVYNWNAYIAQSENSIFYFPHITKTFVGSLTLLYLLFRGIIRPLQVRVKPSFLFPYRWIEVSFVGVCLDIVKAPGLVWGAIILLCRRLGIMKKKVIPTSFKP